MFTRDATRQPRILALVISYSIPTIINLVKEHHRFLCKQRACCASPRDNTRDSNVVKQSSSVSLASPLTSLTRYFSFPVIHSSFSIAKFGKIGEIVCTNQKKYKIFVLFHFYLP